MMLAGHANMPTAGLLAADAVWQKDIGSDLLQLWLLQPLLPWPGLSESPQHQPPAGQLCLHLCHPQ